MVKIRITPLQPGIHEFRFQPSATELDLETEDFPDIGVDVKLTMHHRRIQVSFDVEATATLLCDRTMRPFDQRISGSYAILFVSSDAPDSDRDEEDDYRVIHVSEQELDLTQDVRDTLLLAVPVRRVAPEAEDMEIPREFGRPDPETEIDPRWEALKKLRE